MTFKSKFLAVLLAGSMLAGVPTPAKSEPISLAIGLTGALGFLGPAAGVVGGLIVSTTLSIGASLISRALQPKPKQQQAGDITPKGAQLSMQMGGAVPRSCIFGHGATAGHMLYWNLHGDDNQFLQLVYAIGDGPHKDCVGVIIGGEFGTLGDGAGEAAGRPVTKYTVNGNHHMWVKFHAGYEDQAADPLLVDWSNPAGRWPATNRLAGICYIVVTMAYNEELFPSGIPSFLFLLDGRLCYDPRKDSTNGGVGSHRWDDEHTWEWSSNPAVCLYNYQRGIYRGGELVLGQGLAPFDLLTDMYVAAANDCEEQVSTLDGSEPRYLIAMQVGADRQHRDVIQDFLDSMAGELSEQTGAFGPIAGVSQIVAMTATDADLIVGKPVKFSAKRSRNDLINAVFGTYTDWTQQWQTISYPPRTSSEDELVDGERLAKQVDYPQVIGATQVQRLGEIERRLSRGQATASITLGMKYMPLDPADWFRWNSSRYGDRTYRIRSRAMNPDETVTLSLEQISADVYDWNPVIDQLDPLNPGDLPGSNELILTVAGFTLQDVSINGANGLVIPALKALWSPTTDRTITAVIVQYRVKGTGDTQIKQVRFDRPSAGEGILAGDIQAATVYEARATIETDPPRTTAWTEWVEETAPATHIVPTAQNVDDQALIDAFNRTLADKYDRFIEYVDAQVRPALDAIALIEAERDAAGFNTRQQVRGQMDAIRRAQDAKREEVRETLQVEIDGAKSTIEYVQEVAVSTAGAFADFTTTVSAQFGDAFSQIETNQTAISNVDTAFGSYVVTTNATLGSLSSSVSTNASAIASANSSISSLTNTVSANYNSLSSSVSTNASAIATAQGQLYSKYGLLLNSGGYVAGFESINTGQFSSITFQFDAFRIATSGYSPRTVFQLATINGFTQLGLRGDLIVDGAIETRTIATGSITAIKMSANSITAGNAAIAALAVQSFNMQDSAVTVTAVQQRSDLAGSDGATVEVSQVSLVIDTTGLAGKLVSVKADFSCGYQAFSGSAWSWDCGLLVEGSQVDSRGGSSARADTGVNLSGVYSFFANGGLHVITVRALFVASAGLRCAARTLSAQGVKR